jgi:hypothetical protein
MSTIEAAADGSLVFILMALCEVDTFLGVQESNCKLNIASWRNRRRDMVL